jgi:hypothetical protein
VRRHVNILRQPCHVYALIHLGLSHVEVQLCTGLVVTSALDCFIISGGCAVMLRGVSGVSLCAFQLAMSAPSGAQSFIEVTGGPDVTVQAPLGPPKSITQLYTPRSASASDLSLLVDESQAVAAAPVASITMTSAPPAATAVVASSDPTTRSNFITVSNVRGFHEQE